MKLWPDLVLGGSSPVVACLRHSMMVCASVAGAAIARGTGRRPMRHRERRGGLPALPGGGAKRCIHRIEAAAPCWGGWGAYRLAGAIVAHDQGQRALELDDGVVVRREGADALDEQLRGRGQGAAQALDALQGR
jgi:hypothetical protein